jgi:hypothetical protein
MTRKKMGDDIYVQSDKPCSEKKNGGKNAHGATIVQCPVI